MRAGHCPKYSSVDGKVYNRYTRIKCMESKAVDQMHFTASWPITISSARAAVGVLRLSGDRPEAAVQSLHKAAAKLLSQT